MKPIKFNICWLKNRLYYISIQRMVFTESSFIHSKNLKEIVPNPKCCGSLRHLKQEVNPTKSTRTTFTSTHSLLTLHYCWRNLQNANIIELAFLVPLPAYVMYILQSKFIMVSQVVLENKNVLNIILHTWLLFAQAEKKIIFVAHKIICQVNNSLYTLYLACISFLINSAYVLPAQ